jgi:hypothetical protein
MSTVLFVLRGRRFAVVSCDLQRVTLIEIAVFSNWFGFTRSILTGLTVLLAV